MLHSFDLKNPLCDQIMGKANASLRNWYLDCVREACSIVSALKESFLITTSKTSFSFAFYFGFFYTRGDSGAHTSFISASLLHKSIHCIIFHFDAHLSYFSSRIHNCLSRKREYQRKKKKPQTTEAITSYTSQVIIIAALLSSCFSLSYLSSWVERAHLAIKPEVFVHWEKHFYIRNSCDFFCPHCHQPTTICPTVVKGTLETIFWRTHNLQKVFSRNDKLKKRYWSTYIIICYPSILSYLTQNFSND